MFLYVCKQTFPKLYNLRIPWIKNAKCSGYCFYMNTSIQGDFQICINVPLNCAITSFSCEKGMIFHTSRTLFAFAWNVKSFAIAILVFFLFASAWNAKSFAIAILVFYFFLSFSSLFLDRLAKVIFKVLSSCCFERVWPGLELIIWYVVCFQPRSFRNKQ